MQFVQPGGCKEGRQPPRPKGPVEDRLVPASRELSSRGA
jgi:hypothetical protein